MKIKSIIKHIGILRFQKALLVIGIFIAIANSIVSGILVNCINGKNLFKVESYIDCNTSFCNAMQSANTILNGYQSSLFKSIRLFGVIINNNIGTTARELFSKKYLFSAPYLALKQNSVGIGLAIKCVDNGFIKILFPHGFLEIAAMIIFFATYYAFIINILINVLLVLTKKNAEWEKIFVSVIFWLGVVISLYTIAAVLESAHIVFDMVQ